MGGKERAYQNKVGVSSVEGVALVDVGHGGVDAVGVRGLERIGDVDAEEGVVLWGWSC